MEPANQDALPRGLATTLSPFQPDPASQLPLEVQKTVFLAGLLQARATALQTPAERRQQAELDRMMQRPEDKCTLMQITDQAFRARSPYRVADQLTHVLDVQGVPRFFSPLERAALKGFQSFGSYLPGVAVPLVKEYMQRETANVILPADRELLARHLQQRREEGVRMNVNVLGEALLGEREAERRLKRYLEALQRPEIEVISVKISTIFSQIWPLARRHSIEVLADRLELLYRAAMKSRFRHADGREVPKFVYLDMEEYRDMSITSEAFMKSLDRPGMEHVAAGIALQSYIPDSHRTQLQLNAWARERVGRGGQPIVIRLVKGANLEMERVEASLMNWPQAPYKSKLDTDANFKRMLVEGFRPENLRGGASGDRLAQPVRSLVCPDPGAGESRTRVRAVRNAGGHGQSPAACTVRDLSAVCCCMPRPAGGRTSSTRSVISCGDWMRTPAPTIFCGTRSSWKWAARTGSDWSPSSSPRTVPSPLSRMRRAAPRIGGNPRPRRCRPIIPGRSSGTSRTPTFRWCRMRSGPRNSSPAGNVTRRSTRRRSPCTLPATR